MLDGLLLDPASAGQSQRLAEPASTLHLHPELSRYGALCLSIPKRRTGPRAAAHMGPMLTCRGRTTTGTTITMPIAIGIGITIGGITTTD